MLTVVCDKKYQFVAIYGTNNTESENKLVNKLLLESLNSRAVFFFSYSDI